jgi:hypothetical protein
VLSNKKRAVLAAVTGVKGDYVEAWCSAVLTDLGVAGPPQRSELRDLGISKEPQQQEPAGERLEAGLRALKQECPHADLPVLVVDADSSVTPQQLSRLFRQFKLWAADEQLAKCIVVLQSSRAALTTACSLHGRPLESVVIGDLTDDQAVAHCRMQLQQRRTAHADALTDDAQLLQLARDIVQLVGNRVLTQQRVAAAWKRCSSVDEIMAVCTAHELSARDTAQYAVDKLIYSPREQSKGTAAVDAFMTQLLQSGSGVEEVDVVCKFQLDNETLYDINAAYVPNVLRIDPATRVITLDTAFMTEAVKQYLADARRRHQPTAL